jgi:hypothetical protein
MNACELIVNNGLEIAQWLLMGYVLFSIGRLWEAIKK